MPFAYTVPEWSVGDALAKLQGTRLAAVGSGWTASADTAGGVLLARAGYVPDPDPALHRKTPEGWTYHGHRRPLGAFLRPKRPESVEFTTLAGITILAPLAQLAPQAIDFSTGQSCDFVDEWARAAFKLHEERETFTENGKDYWRLTGTDADLARVIFLCLQAVYAVTAEALTDCRIFSTTDRAQFLQTVWGYTLGKTKPADGGG